MKSRLLIFALGVIIIISITAFAVYQYRNANEEELQGTYVLLLEESDLLLS